MNQSALRAIFDQVTVPVHARASPKDMSGWNAADIAHFKQAERDAEDDRAMVDGSARQVLWKMEAVPEDQRLTSNEVRQLPTRGLWDVRRTDLYLGSTDSGPREYRIGGDPARDGIGWYQGYRRIVAGGKAHEDYKVYCWDAP